MFNYSPYSSFFNKQIIKKCALLVAVLAVPLGCASTAPTVVPAHERSTEVAETLSGPTENKGIEAVIQLGETDLSADFPAMEGRALRAREIHLAPGGVVAAHTHELRPGVAYILTGEVLEHREGEPEPILRKAGDVAFEYSGVSHWWQNISDETVRAFVVDVIEQQDDE